MMKIFGNPMSTCTRKVLTTLHETGTPFEMTVVDLTKGEHKQPAHLARQPFGQVPALNDEGFEMYESRAMCRYINDKAKGNLVPTDLQARAKMEQWISIENCDFSGPAMKLIYNYVFYPMMGKAEEPQAIMEGNTGVERCLSVMEPWLAKNTYMAGTQFTLADIYYLPYIEYLMTTPGKALFAKHASVMAWWGRCSERASWRAAVGR